MGECVVVVAFKEGGNIGRVRGTLQNRNVHEVTITSPEGLSGDDWVPMSFEKMVILTNAVAWIGYPKPVEEAGDDVTANKDGEGA